MRSKVGVQTLSAMEQRYGAAVCRKSARTVTTAGWEAVRPPGYPLNQKLNSREHQPNRPESVALTAFSYGHHTFERACCTISTKTFRVSAGLLTSRKNA